MARSIAGATVSFGLVSIPVKLYTATRSTGTISFHLLHAKCGTRLKQQYICPTDQEIVPRDDMVKGPDHQEDDSRWQTLTVDHISRPVTLRAP